MKHDEQGIALVIVMFLMATLSALAVSMMFLAQTETASSRNYRTMSQARYAAEAGVHKSINYLLNSYTAPTTFTSYDMTKSPVTCVSGCTHNAAAGAACTATSVATAVSTGCVVLSGISGIASNYPDSTAASAFAAAAQGTLAMNGSGATTNAALGTATYGTAAILMSMQSIAVYGSSSGTSVIQTWQIVSDGTVPPSTAAIVEVSGSLEREIVGAQTYAVFATNQGCGAITISGDADTDSYNSSTMTTTPPTTTNSSGDIGTNGNLDVSGSVSIHGTLSTPRTGAGACSASNPDAITGSGSWTYGGTTQLSQSISFPTPTVPTGVPTTSVSISSSLTTATCTALVTASGWACTVVGSTVTLTPVTSNTLTLGNLSIGSNTDLVIAGGSSEILNVNSFALGSNATMTMSSSPNTSVAMNIAGQSLGSTKPLDVSGGGTVNATYDASRLQILYAGTGEIDTVGNNTVAATIYAPNALVKTAGHGNFYGSILSNTFTDTGGAILHYDTSLQKKYQTAGNYMMTSFSWKKY